MRFIGSLSLILTLLLILGAGSAEARRRATATERAAIAARFHAPAKCARVWISTVDDHWATYQFDDSTFKDPDCAAVAADGVAILQFRKGAWRHVTAGSSFDCPVPKTPPKIVKDLHVKCISRG